MKKIIVALILLSSCNQIEIAKLRREAEELELSQMRKQISRDSAESVILQHEIDSLEKLYP